MELQPRLIDVAAPDDPEGVVVVLHGGASRRAAMMVSPTQLSVLRMIPIARRIARAGHGRLTVVRLLNSQRGWDTHHTPVDDALWALARLEERYGRRLPTCLVGHSLGGRAALLAGGAPGVRGVVALAPYVLPQDAPRGLDSRQVLFVHGDGDRIASPARALQLARRLDAGFVSVAGAKHAMLRRHGVFSGLAAELVQTTLLDDAPAGTLAAVLGGQRFVEV